MNHIITKMLVDLENGLPNKDIQYFVSGFPKDTISKQMCAAGTICINPVRTSLNPITTGITDREEHTLNIIIIKSMQIKVYNDPAKETGDTFLLRLMDGRDASGILQTNTVRYIIRNNLRTYGINQPAMNIQYDDDRVLTEGVVTATMTVIQLDHIQQPLK